MPITSSSLEGDFLPLEIENEGFNQPSLVQTASVSPSDTMLDIDTTPTVLLNEAAPSTDPEVTKNRARKAHIALGAQSPGLDSIRAQMDMGEEESLRKAVAASEAIRDRQTRMGMVQEATRKINRPLTVAEAEELMSIAGVDARKDPATILEELYGERVVSTIPSMLKDPSIHQEALNNLPEDYLDSLEASKTFIAKNQIARAVLEDVQSEWDKQGLFSTAVSYAKQVIPFWSYSNLTGAVDKAPTGFSLSFGNTIEEEVEYLYSLKPSDFKRELTGAIRKLAEDSPLDALLFAQGIINYSKNDQALDNVFGAMDLAAFLPLAQQARLLTASGRAAAATESTAKAAARTERKDANILAKRERARIKAERDLARAKTPVPSAPDSPVKSVGEQAEPIIYDTSGVTVRYEANDDTYTIAFKGGDATPVSNEVENAYLSLSQGNYARRVRIADLAKQFPGLSKAEFDQKLLDMQADGRLVLYTLDDPTQVTKADKAAAVKIGPYERHIVYLDRGKAPKPQGEGVATGQRTVQSTGDVQKTDQFIRVDPNIILDRSERRFDKYLTHLYGGEDNNAGLYEFMKDAGYGKSIMTTPLHDGANVDEHIKALVNGFMSKVPAEFSKEIKQKFNSLMNMFLSDRFNPWPMFGYMKDYAHSFGNYEYANVRTRDKVTKQITGKKVLNPAYPYGRPFVAVDFNSAIEKVGPKIRAGKPLYANAVPLPKWLADDPNALAEMILWHETAHTVVKDTVKRLGLEDAVDEDFVNSLALAKLYKQRVERSGIHAYRKNHPFGRNPEPIPYTIKNYEKTAGVREPAVIFSDKPLSSVRSNSKAITAYTNFDNRTKTVTVYREGVLKQWELQPWKNTKRAGVKPLDDSEFPTPETWLDFTVEKAKLQGLLPRKPKETLADWTNRTNQLALQSVRAKRAEKAATLSNSVRGITEAGMADDMAEGMSAAGMVDEAASVDVYQRALDKWNGLDPLDDSLAMRKRVPSIFNVEQLGFSTVREHADRIYAALERNATTLLGIPLNNSAIVRLPEGALTVAIDAAKASLTKTYDRVQDAFLDVSFGGPFSVTRPEDQLVNTSVVHLRMGKPDATLFDNPTQAATYGVDMYGLSSNQFSILQQGNGFYINIAKSVDETLDSVRNQLISTDNKSEGGMLNAFLNLIRTPEDQLSKLTNANRKLATTSVQEIHRIMLESSKSISKELTSKERNQLSTLWEANRDFIDEATGERGMYYTTVSEFEDAFNTRFRQMPTPEQSIAYFSYVQLNDIDYVLRNLALHRDLSRMGAEEVRVFYDDMLDTGEMARTSSRPFAGRITDRIPFEDTSEDFGIWLYDPAKKKGEFFLRSQVTKDVLDELTDATGRRGFKIVEVVNPLEKPLLDVARTSETIHFAVVKDFDNKKFDWSILPRRPGGHVEYGDQFFVKQPKIRRSNTSGSLRHIYEGDTALLNAPTGAEAKKFAQAAETARQLLKAGKEGELKTFLYQNTPWDLETWKSFFSEKELPDGRVMPPLLHLDDPITWTYTGRNTSDMDHFKGEFGKYSNFFNGIRSKYNLFAQGVDKKYLGARDPDLPRVIENGTEARPLYSLAKPRLLSPLDTLNKAVANISRSRHLNDFKISAVESFIEEFKDVMKTDIAELRRNPVYYFHNPVWDTETTNQTLLSSAKAVRRANMMFIGTESELSTKLFWAQSKLVDTIYKKLGQKASDFVTEKYLPTLKDPFTYARSIAFHTKLGLFNPVQLMLQAQSWVHVASIAGIEMASKAGFDAIRMRQLALTEDEGVINHWARMSGRADMFKESYAEMKKTGYYNVGGEVAWRNDTLDPPLFKGPIGTFLEKGTMFFDEGERFVRLSAWNSAFYAWREANPGVKMTNAIRNQILNRADLMAVNMTRASNAAWQQGLWSIPTQFLAFNARLAEQLLPGFSSRLTAAEKRRAYLTYSAIYGVPVGAGAATGVWPYYEDIRQAALERGIELDNKLVQSFHEGMLSTLTSVITGKDYNINERFGPGGTSFFKDIIDGEKGVVDLVFGASGNIIGDMIRTAEPALNGLMSLFDKDTPAPNIEDFIEVTRNISTINNVAKAWYMYNQGNYFTRNGTVVTNNNSGMDAFMTGVLGLTPRDVTDSFLMVKSLKEQKEAQNAAEKEVIKWYRKAIQHYNDNDRELGDAYLKRAKAWLASSGINPADYGSVLSKAVKNNETLFRGIREDFWKKAPVDQAPARRDRVREQMSRY
jgi:hypothetical protein